MGKWASKVSGGGGISHKWSRYAIVFESVLALPVVQCNLQAESGPSGLHVHEVAGDADPGDSINDS